MPAIIDHEARRLALAALAADLIAAEGLAAATVRAVAEAAGFSTKVVSHYFQDKRHLLLEAYRCAARDTGEQARAAAGADAVAYAAALCPGTPAMVRNWKVWFAFWGSAISDDGFAREQARMIDDAERRLAGIFAVDRRFAHLDDAALARLSGEVMVGVLGVALRAVFDLENWPADRQRQVVLDRFRPALDGADGAVGSLANPSGARE